MSPSDFPAPENAGNCDPAQGTVVVELRIRQHVQGLHALGGVETTPWPDSATLVVDTCLHFDQVRSHEGGAVEADGVLDPARSDLNS